MLFNVFVTEQAESDLRKIYNYIRVDLSSPLAADNLLKLLEDGISKLSEMPNRCRIYEYEPWHSKCMRVLTVKNYLVFYFVNEEQKSVNVVRVFYGGQNLNDDLKG